MRSFARTVGPPLCRASVAVITPVSRQIWWVQVVVGRPQARLHSCEGRSPSLDLVQICRIWFANTSRRSLATCPKRSSLRLRTMYQTSNRLVRCRTSSLDTKSCHLVCRMRRWHRTWNESSLFQSACMCIFSAVIVKSIKNFYKKQTRTDYLCVYYKLYSQSRKIKNLP